MAMSRLTLLVFAVIVLLIGICIGFIAGYFTHLKRVGQNVEFGDPTITQQLIESIRPDNIKTHLRWLTSRPHLAGTEGEKRVAEYIANFWKENGLSPVRILPYDVLLSYPDSQNPNRIILYDGEDRAQYLTQLFEKIIRPEQNDSEVVAPFNAYSPPGNPRGSLVYVNYGRIEDYTNISSKINLTGKICIARYGRIFRADKAVFGQKFGCIGLILYTDPKDYAVSGIREVYPDSWWLPGTGVQRGTLKQSNGGLGDPLTPMYPSIESAYRIPLADADLVKIPVHPIGYDDARALLGNMAGDVAPDDWQGSLNITYKLGPASVNQGYVQMNISTNYHRATTYNVMGFIEGSSEPDRYVIIGNHYDAWVFGAVDPSSGTATMLELSRAMVELTKEGWRPKRSIVFCAWGAEEHGLIGSREWVENYGQILGDRAVVYMNVDSAVQGSHVFRARASPMISSTLNDVAKQIPNPDPEEVRHGRATVFDTWALRSPQYNENGSSMGVPRIPLLGSGSDFAPFVTGVGVTCTDIRYNFDESLRISSFPLYHSVYETIHLYETYIDPTYKFAASVAQFWGELARRHADYAVIPFSVSDFAAGINSYFSSFRTRYAELLLSHGCEAGLGFLTRSVERFKLAAIDFQDRLNKADLTNALSTRILNDQLMSLERAFIDPAGLPNRPLVRNVLYAPSAHDSYSAASFPGLTDALFEIDKISDNTTTTKRWEEVKKQLSVVSFFIDSAANALAQPTRI